VHGLHSAPLVVLSRNPRFSAESVEEELRPDRCALLIANLKTEGGARHPGLAPEFVGGLGGKWWADCFRGVTKTLSCSLETLADKVLAVEVHAYRSVSWTSLPVTLPSSWFGFELVTKAMEREAVIVVLRGRKDWEVAVPGLRTYGRRIVSSNPRRSSISPRTCGNQFELVVGALGA
jgi:hypothetical protein